MLIYFFVIFFVIVLIYIVPTNKKNGFVGLFLSALFLGVFASLRSDSVGTDTAGYIRLFETSCYNINTFSQIFSGLEWSDEPLFKIYARCISFFTGSRFLYLFLYSFISILLVFLFIRAYSPIAYISVLIFICLGYYTFGFNGIRQFIALSICLYSYKYIIESKFKNFIFYVLIAIMFHKTSFIILPLYFMRNLSISYKTLVIFIVISVIIVSLLPFILQVGASADSRYELYTSGTATGAKYLTLFYAILPFIYFNARNDINPSYKRNFDLFFSASILGSMVYIIVFFTQSYVEITRVALYFNIADIILIPMVVDAYRRRYGSIVSVLTVILSLIYFYLFVTQMANLVPYTFNQI